MMALRVTLIVLGRFLAVLVGAAPASYLCIMAYLVAMVGFMALLTGEIGGLILVVWGLSGFYGTLSLWAVAFGFVRGWSVTGLLVGTLAILPFAGPYLTGQNSSSLGSNPDALIFVGPAVVALAWLIALAFRPHDHPISNPSDAETART